MDIVNIVNKRMINETQFILKKKKKYVVIN